MVKLKEKEISKKRIINRINKLREELNSAYVNSKDYKVVYELSIRLDYLINNFYE